MSIENNLPISMNAFFGKSIAFVWELMFTRPMFQTADMQSQHDLLKEAARLLDEGVLRLTVTEQGGELTAENLRKAHAKLETGAMIGKLVLGGIGNG